MASVAIEVVHRPSGRKTHHRPSGDTVIVGRDRDADIRLLEGSVSRRHAQLVRDGSGHWSLQDLGSRNGTFVGRTPVVDRRVLSGGESIVIDDYTLVLHVATADELGKTTAKEKPGKTLLDAGLTAFDSPFESLESLSDLDTPQVSAAQLKALLDFSSHLLTTKHSQDRLRALCGLLVDRRFRGRSAMILRVPAAAPREPRVLAGPIPSTRAEAPRLSHKLLGSVSRTGVAALASSRPDSRPTPALQLTVADPDDSAAIASPFNRQEETTDLLYVTLPERYGTGEWLALASLATEQLDQAERIWRARRVAEEQAMLERELEQAHDIQSNLVPDDLESSNLEISFGFEPCRWVGGDYVDAVELADGRYLVTVMDVCGKGLQAALVASALHTVVHLLARQGNGPLELVTGLNRHLVETLPDDSFVTMLVIAVDPVTSRLEAISCGHPPAVIVSETGIRRFGDPPNLPLGCLDTEYSNGAIDELQPGEVLCAYSDGLFETVNGEQEMFGLDRTHQLLRTIARAHARKSLEASEWVDELTRELAVFRGEEQPTDDTSFFVIVRR